MTLAHGRGNVDTDFSLHRLIPMQHRARDRQGEPGSVLPNPRGRGGGVAESPGNAVAGEALFDDAP